MNNRLCYMCKFNLHVVIMVIVVVIASAGCFPDTTNDPLEKNLRLAGKNRKELNMVLNHYSRPGDSLKLMAAKFLILNMDAHFTKTSPYTDSMIVLLANMEGFNDVQAINYIDSCRANFEEMPDTRFSKVCDLNAITAEYLIANIDRSFEIWENALWHEYVDFDTFCNYVLPYRSGDGRMQDWREVYYDRFAGSLDSFKTYRAMDSVITTLLTLNRWSFRYLLRLGKIGDFGGLDMLNVKAGNCHHVAHGVDLLLREFGIPSSTTRAPQWANHNDGHAWNAIMDTTYNMLPYASGDFKRLLLDLKLRPTKTAKLYQYPYRKNPYSFAFEYAGLKSKHVPPYLRNECMLDVTAEYVPVSDASVNIAYNKAYDKGHVFLCTFARGRLNALDWSKTNAGEAMFTDLGRDAMYIAAFYRSGQYFAATDPINISLDGELNSIPLDMSSWRDVRLYRKYALKNSMFRYTRTFKGMKIQISDDIGFESPLDIHVINRWPSPVIQDRPRERDRWKWVEYQDSVAFEIPVNTRYLRFFAAPGEACIVGDIECIDSNGDKINGTAFGSHEGAENVLDGLYGETYHDPDTLGWVAIDFGQKRQISKIRYLPSHDSNSIQVGDNYELFYWDKEWVSLGQQQAEHKYLDCNVPASALFWLKNLDRGKEERIFTLDIDGEQVWW